MKTNKINTTFITTDENTPKSSFTLEKDPSQEINPSDTLQKNQIIFHSSFPGGQEETIRISQEGFFYKGEKVEDVHNVYERFNDWLKGAERS